MKIHQPIRKKTSEKKQIKEEPIQTIPEPKIKSPEPEPEIEEKKDICQSNNVSDGEPDSDEGVR
jgi:hypothetical protein